VHCTLLEDLSIKSDYIDSTCCHLQTTIKVRLYLFTTLAALYISLSTASMSAETPTDLLIPELMRDLALVVALMSDVRSSFKVPLKPS